MKLKMSLPDRSVLAKIE